MISGHSSFGGDGLRKKRASMSVVKLSKRTVDALASLLWRLVIYDRQAMVARRSCR